MEGLSSQGAGDSEKIRLHNIDESCKLTRENIEAFSDRNMLMQIRSNLASNVRKNEEKLRQLTLVQRYHSKNSPDKLVTLIEKWVTTSQKSLQELLEKLPDNNECDFPRLLNSLGIDPRTVQYDLDSNSFYWKYHGKK